MGGRGGGDTGYANHQYLLLTAPAPGLSILVAAVPLPAPAEAPAAAAPRPPKVGQRTLSQRSSKIPRFNMKCSGETEILYCT